MARAPGFRPGSTASVEHEVAIVASGTPTSPTVASLIDAPASGSDVSEEMHAASRHLDRCISPLDSNDTKIVTELDG